MYLRLVFSSFFLLALLLLNQYVLSPMYLYYEIWWLDIPMHMLGGLGLALFFISVSQIRGRNVSYLSILLSVFVIAIAWEVYEYVYGVLGIQEWNGWFDTIKDIIDGLVGGSIAYWLHKKSYL